MSTVQHAWKSGWTAADAPQIGFASVRASEGTWNSGALAGLRYRSLGLRAASGGLLDAHHLRLADDAAVEETGWHRFDFDFEFYYVLSGSIDVEGQDGERHRLDRWATASYPPRYWRNWHSPTPDFSAVRIVGPADGDLVSDPTGALRSGEGIDDRQKAVYTEDTPDAYEMGTGPRSYRLYRDLQTREATDGRIHIHVVRSTGERARATGWHHHSMAQWFMILGGSSWVRHEVSPKQKLEVLDSMCIGRGMRHDLGGSSEDYAVLEMCVPATYETVPVPEPDGADSRPEGWFA